MEAVEVVERPDTAAESASVEVQAADLAEGVEAEEVAVGAPNASTQEAVVARPSCQGTRHALPQGEAERKEHGVPAAVVREAAAEEAVVPADCSAWAGEPQQPMARSPLPRGAPSSCSRAGARTASSHR